QPQSSSTAAPSENNWIASAKRDPFSALLLFTIAATVIAFFFVFRLYAAAPIMVWAWNHWLPNLNQEHGKLVIPISLALVWYHRKKLQAAPKQGSNWGILFLVVGV